MHAIQTSVCTGFPRDLNKTQMLMQQACDLGPWASHLTSTQGNYLRNFVQLLSGQTRISAARLPRKTMRAMSPLKQPCFNHQGGCSVQAEFQYSSCVVQVPGPCVCSWAECPTNSNRHLLIFLLNIMIS